MLHEITKILIRKGFCPTHVGIPISIMKGDADGFTYGVTVKCRNNFTAYSQYWKSSDGVTAEDIVKKLIYQINMDEALR